MPRPVEDRSDVGGAAQFNGPVPLSAPTDPSRFPLLTDPSRFPLPPLSAPPSRFPLPAFRSQAVLDEVMRGEPDDPAVSLVPKAVADWMRVIESNPPTPFRGPAVGFQPARLGAGGTPLAGSLP